MVTAVVLLACALTVHAQTDTRRHFCGKRLTSKLFTLCGGMYNKRLGTIETGTQLPEAGRRELASHRLERSVALDMFSTITRGRRRRGIVDECCHRGCTIKELSAYCQEKRK